MTGFGVASGEAGANSIRIEVRSVNHRFLQVKSRLPSEFSFLDPQIEALLRKKLERGAVSLSVQASRTANAESVSINVDVVQRYAKLLAGVSKKTGISGELGLAELVQLPGVIGTSTSETDTDAAAKKLLKIAGESVAAMIEMREAEGAALESDLRKNAAAATKVAARIEKRMPVVVREHHKSLKKRVADLLGATNKVGDSDLARELAMLAERLDVSEELTRLESHLEQFEKVLTKGGAVGRRLDFLVQELQREANTIGSKCNDAQVAHAVVELKTLIERVREQIQNVE